MTRATARIGAMFIGLLLAAAATGADLLIRLDAREVTRKRVHTTITLAAKPGPLALVFPKWIPGEHGPTGPLASMIGLEIRANGERLAWTRDPLDLYALHVTVPPATARLEISLESGLAAGDEGDNAARTSTGALAVIPWNEFLLIPKGVDADTLIAVATLIPPSGWTVASALDSRPAAGGALEFESASVARLIDSPALLGLHAKQIELAGAEPRGELRHRMAIVADSAAALVVPDDFGAGYGRLVAEAGQLFGARLYRHYTWLLSLSDHVAHFGLEHHESSDNRDGEEALGEAERRMDVAALLGHEYVHSWNGKYRRPQGLLSPDYQKPMDGSLLWVYEGLTQYWGYVLPTRAGLISPEFFRDHLADAAAEFTLSPGARWRPMADTAVAAQALYDAPDGWTSSRRSVDFYDASIFLWLDVEQQLRSLSQGRAGLDDFARRFYAGPSGEPRVRPYGEAEVYAGLAAIAPADWRALTRRHLEPTGTAALTDALERAGWRLAYSPEKNADVEVRQKRRKWTERQWSIGLRLDKDAKIIDVIEDRAAARAGAAPGMTIVAVNGRKYSTAVLDAAILAAQATRQPIALLVENDEFYRTLAVEYYDGPRYPHLERIDGRPDALAAVIGARAR